MMKDITHKIGARRESWTMRKNVLQEEINMDLKMHHQYGLVTKKIRVLGHLIR